MISDASKSSVQRAKALYDAHYRQEYERLYTNKFLSIEPESGQLFLGDSMDEAINASTETIPAPRDSRSVSRAIQIK